MRACSLLRTRKVRSFSHSPVYSFSQSNGTQRAYAREVYSIEGTRVTLNAGSSWICTCKQQPSAGECTHIEQARVFREMRGPKRDEDTIELELGAAQLQILTQAGAQAPVLIEKSAQTPRRRRLVHVSRWGAAAAMAGIAALSSGITYLATATSPPIAVADQSVPNESPPLQIMEEVPAAPDAPVQFVNPFDVSEVFEFPSTTSKDAARDAVAALLLERARDRLSPSGDHRSQPDKAGKHDKSTRSASLL